MQCLRRISGWRVVSPEVVRYCPASNRVVAQGVIFDANVKGRTMIRADYIVLTFPRTDTSEAIYPTIVGYWLPQEDRRPYTLYGFRGYRSGKVFIGEREDRYIVQATGAIAHDVAMRLQLPVEHEISVARIDVQHTFITADADRLINNCQPDRAYRASRWIQVNERGATLYVGSPKSDVRLRIYNKSAESGLKPETCGDYLRVELQFRNKRADHMFRAIRARAPRFPFLTQLKRMVDNFMYQIVHDSIAQDEEELFPEDFPGELDALSRRKAWIERSVIPAFRKVLAEDPGYLKTFLSMLDSIDEDVI